MDDVIFIPLIPAFFSKSVIATLLIIVNVKYKTQLVLDGKMFDHTAL